MAGVNRSDLAKVVAVNLLDARERANLSKAALGRRVGVSASSVGNWEMGRCLPGTAELVSVADALGVSVHWFLGREPGARAQLRPAPARRAGR